MPRGHTSDPHTNSAKDGPLPFFVLEIEAQRASIILDGKQNGSRMTLKE